MPTYNHPAVGPILPVFGAPASVRPTTNTIPNSASLRWGSMLRLKIRDVLSGEPLRYGAYIRSCRITLDGEEHDYVCHDQDRHPRASRSIALYGKGRLWQTERFYKYVSSSLKRLQRRDGDTVDESNADLRSEMKIFYNDWKGLSGDDAVDDIAVIEGTAEDSDSIENGLELALSGRDHVDQWGDIYISLPYVDVEKELKVRIEFHDIKFIPEQKYRQCVESTGIACPANDFIDPVWSIANSMSSTIEYDRATAADLEGAANPDKPEHESTIEESNWKLSLSRWNSTDEKKTPFRNFHEFTFTLKPGHNGFERALFALTWCQPVWHVEKAFLRVGQERSTFGRSHTSTAPAICTTHGGSADNYGVFGMYRTRWVDGSLYYRLHGGIDLSGNSRGDANLRTPVVAAHGGQIKRSGGSVSIYHRDLQVLHYVHMEPGDHFVSTNGEWVKAGTLLGKMGRRGFNTARYFKYPSHVHFEFRVAEAAGHMLRSRFDDDENYQVPNGSEPLTDATAIAFLATDEVPKHESVMKQTADPKHIKAQYGKYLRRHDRMYRSWVSEQIGANSLSDFYVEYLPKNHGSYFRAPCRQEYGDSDANLRPLECTCSCRSGAGTLVAAQAKWAQNCWAVRTRKDPHNVPCPGLSEKGPDDCFTDQQRIQYHLWQLDYYSSLFDSDLGSASALSIISFYSAYNRLSDLDGTSTTPSGLSSNIAVKQDAGSEEWRYRTKKEVKTALKAASSDELTEIIDDLKSKLSDEMKW